MTMKSLGGLVLAICGAIILSAGFILPAPNPPPVPPDDDEIVDPEPEPVEPSEAQVVTTQSIVKYLLLLGESHKRQAAALLANSDTTQDQDIDQVRAMTLAARSSGFSAWDELLSREQRSNDQSIPWDSAKQAALYADFAIAAERAAECLQECGQ